MRWWRSIIVFLCFSMVLSFGDGPKQCQTMSNLSSVVAPCDEGGILPKAVPVAETRLTLQHLHGCSAEALVTAKFAGLSMPTKKFDSVKDSERGGPRLTRIEVA